METITITKEKLNKFVACGKHYITVNVANKSLLWVNVDTLLEIAIKKLKKVEREKELARLSLCKKTATKHIDMSKNGNYQFTEEDHKKLLEAVDTIDQSTVDMPCMVIPKGEYPEKGLTYDIRDSFKGIVIPLNEYDVKNADLAALLEAENARIEQEEELEEAE